MPLSIIRIYTRVKSGSNVTFNDFTNEEMKAKIFI